ncbi:MAG: class I tRNA ligase family protein [Patescibacteria group bacterium]|jgi:leucyl-tRNA synthetase
MKSGYTPKDIEKKWQDAWEEQGIYHAQDNAKAERFYGLIEFPYPSGEGLHVGHPRSYTALDIMTRKKRMEGKNVMYPIGWDAFGLPTENFAIKHKIKPQDATKQNVANFTRQIKSLGLGFDWSREINTTDPKYYKWTQWMFLKFYGSWYDAEKKTARPIEELPIPKNIESQGDAAVATYRDSKRMAYKATTTINWCPNDKIGLANEEAQGGICERCGGKVEKREKAQWMIRITAYAERLINDLNDVDYLDRIKAQQINWIGRSEGAEILFMLSVPGQPDGRHGVKVFTTRPDTIFGVTFLVVSPETAKSWLDTGWNAPDNVKEYVQSALMRTDMERMTEGKTKTGVFTEVTATNPANQEKIPVWVSDYVLGNYGTGSIMGVPAQDERDRAFAETFYLPISEAANDEMAIDALEEAGQGKRATTYKLRDWVFSRQRYWGEPIPMIICESCGIIPVHESELPVMLPDVDAYEPTDTGESPLAAIDEWVNVTCPSCGGEAKRETDTMPNWAGSSWYFMRYCDPKNDDAFADPKKLKYWMPVDLYNGGMEHTTLHLLYSRFWYKFLWDLGLVPEECGSEPYAKRRSHALILGEGGVKMSKSKGNVVNPDDIVGEYGADVFRVYEMFIGPFDQDAPWDTNGIEGVRRFLEKVWRLFDVAPASDATLTEEVETLLHQTIKKVGDDIETMNFNTAVSTMMILTNALTDLGAEHISQEVRTDLLKILAPFAPHMTEELWSALGQSGSIHKAEWPSFDESKLQASTFTLVVQVNGKVRDRFDVSSDISEEEATKQALASEKVQASLDGKAPAKIVYVKGRLVSIST